ncbi:MAG TPA: hypothetical protein PLZ53_00280 [Candidatus Hydrogenedentes bacterium]|nr:hypothetical protein [Candidatus Hydrogenedentota bacterium]
MKTHHIAQKFDVAGRAVTLEHTGEGNVNDTYLAIFRTVFSEERFILQKINKRVFPHPEQIMQNMRVVTEHVHRRIEEEMDTADRIWQLPRVIPAKDGKDYVLDDDGEFWRAITLIASAHSYGRVQNIEHAHEAGYVLGHFQRMISDIEIDKLHDTLVGFHITPGYLKKYDEALASPEGQERVKISPEAQRCMRFVEARL